MGDWITVPGWSKHQHYKNRHVPWIKVYTELNSRDDWLDLTYAQRGLLVTIWLEYERSRERLPLRQVYPRGGRQVDPRTLDALVQAGFVEISSRPSRARERGTTYPKESGAPNTANGAAPLTEKEIPRDPDAVARARALMKQLFDGDS